MTSRIFLTLALLVVCLKPTLSIQCYRCESDNNEYCGENFRANSVLLDDCNKAILSRHLRPLAGSQTFATGCIKIKKERYGTPLVIRTCYFGDVEAKEHECTHNSENSQAYFNCEICKEDACNGSAKSTAGNIFDLVPVLVSLLVKQFLKILS